jgi:uncharacterized membrane protein
MLIELIWRGYSYWSMFIVGGIVFLLVGQINEYSTYDMPLLKQCALSTIIITTVEFVAGCILNLWLKWDIWDYSHLQYNILGQICFPFMVAWFFVSVISVVLDDVLRWLLFGEEKPQYRIF